MFNWRGKKKRTETGISWAGLVLDDEETLSSVFPGNAPNGAYDEFYALSAVMKKAFKAPYALEQLVSPRPLRFTDDRGKNFTVELAGENYPLTMQAKKISLVIPSEKIMSASTADFMGRSVSATKMHGKPVFLNGSDENKVLLFIACHEYGHKVKNAREILDIQKNNPVAWKRATDEWVQYRGGVGPTPGPTTPHTAPPPNAQTNQPPAALLRQKLDLPIGMLASELSLVHFFSCLSAVKQQASYLAILKARPESDKSDLMDLIGNKFSDKLRELNITERQVKDARTVVDRYKGMPAGVPKFGGLLNIPQDLKNAALAAQAGVRILDIVDKIDKGDLSAFKQGDMANFANDGRFINIGKFKNDPQWLIDVQKSNAAAAFGEIEVSSGASDIEGARMRRHLYVGEALKGLANAASEFERLGRKDLASGIKEIMSDYGPSKPSPKAGPAPGPAQTPPGP